MTAQACEYLLYKGRELPMCSDPFGVYLKYYNIKLNPMPICTALWRGYIGSWEITNSRLYLAGLSGTLLGGISLSVGFFFPDSPDRVFAEWFTGNLRIPQGEMLKYYHLGFCSVFESDLFISIENGFVTGTEVSSNTLRQPQQQFLEF